MCEAIGPPCVRLVCVASARSATIRLDRGIARAHAQAEVAACCTRPRRRPTRQRTGRPTSTPGATGPPDQAPGPARRDHVHRGLEGQIDAKMAGLVKELSAAGMSDEGRRPEHLLHQHPRSPRRSSATSATPSASTRSRLLGAEEQDVAHGDGLDPPNRGPPHRAAGANDLTTRRSSRAPRLRADLAGSDARRRRRGRSRKSVVLVGHADRRVDRTRAPMRLGAAARGFVATPNMLLLCACWCSRPARRPDLGAAVAMPISRRWRCRSGTSPRWWSRR